MGSSSDLGRPNHFALRVLASRGAIHDRSWMDSHGEGTMSTHSLKQKYEAEIDRLDREHTELERSWNQVPRFALVALLAPLCGLVWGWGAAVVALLVSAALVGTRAYLSAVRRSENRWNRNKLLDDLSELDTTSSEAAAALKAAQRSALVRSREQARASAAGGASLDDASLVRRTARVDGRSAA
jgi:hypothetical protein